MKRLTSFTLTTACAIAVLAVLATQTRAQETNTLDRTYFTFSSAVELPGVTLEPGEYEFRLADNQRQNVVQVIRRGDMKPMGQFTFAEANRERRTDETVVMFREAREGATPAIQYWYFPNEKIGKEFIYPKDQAERIAARTGQTVRSDGGAVTASASAAPASDAPASAPAPASASTSTPASERVGSDSNSAPSSQQTSTSAPSPAREDAQRNAPVAAQPTAPAGSTAGNRGVAQSGGVTAGASSDAARDASASTSASADAQRNAPASAQPTAAAGSTAGNRGVTEPGAPAASASASTNTSAGTETERASINRDATADRPIGTSGIAQQSDTNTGAAQNDAQVARNELPRTASPLPLSALLGLLSLAGAAGIRMMRA